MDKFQKWVVGLMSLAFLFIVFYIVLILFFGWKIIGIIDKKEGYNNLTPMNIHSEILNNGSSGSGGSGNNIAPYTLLTYYPLIDPTGKLSDKSIQDLWWKYPIFKVGSYDQITNNIRYPNNPDVGRCEPESICNVLYGDRQEHTNYVTPLGPAPNDGVRVNYYSTTTPPFF